MRTFALILLAGCSNDLIDPTLAEAPPPPVLTLDVPDALLHPGYTTALSVTGDLAVGEVVYVVASMARGAGPCLAPLGGACLSVLGPRLVASAVVEETGGVEVMVPVPAAAPIGATVWFQAAVVRGWGGSASVLSNLDASVTEVGVPGCPDSRADNYDPAANVDDGSCTYSDPLDWTPYDFTAYDWKNDCEGGEKYVKVSGLSTGYYVGVQLCSPTRYKIFLGDDLAGTFYSIGDGCGSGQDHCALVGGTYQDFSVDYSTNDGIPGYMRCESETPVFGTLGGAHWTASWYECGVSIP